MGLSRPKIVFRAVAWFIGYVSSQPVVASTMVGTELLPWHVHASGPMQAICQASHTGSPATTLNSKEILLAWLA